LRGAEVDRLSLEEAQEIAETSVSAAARERLVSVEEAAPIKSDIEAYFRKELSSSELNKNCCEIRRASSRKRCSASMRSISEGKVQPRCRSAESKTHSTGQTGRRPQAVVHEKIAGEPEPVAELPANKVR